MDKKAAAKQLLKERTSKKRFKLSEGVTTFRVLPNAKGVAKSEYIDYGMHSEVGPKKLYLRCGKKKDGSGECFLCDSIIPKLEKSGKSFKQQVAERMARRDVFAVQIIYKDGESDKWLGPAMWEMPQSLANGLLGILSRHDVADPKKGYNLTVTRSGTGMRDTRYGSLERDDERSPVPEDIMSRLQPFSALIRKYDEAQMKAAYYGHEQDEAVDEDEDVEEEEDEKPKGKKAVDEDEDEDETIKIKKKSVDADDEEDEDEKPKAKKKVEDEDEEEVVEEEDEDEKPKGKKKSVDADDEEEDEKPKGKKKPKDDDEEEEEDVEVEDLIGEDEDEEEEKPKGKKKPKEEDEDEEDEEEEKPKGKKKSKVEDEEEDEDI